jgi:hypothetical protein
VSGTYPFVSASVGTPFGTIEVNATLTAKDTTSIVEATVQSRVAGIFGIRYNTVNDRGENLSLMHESITLNCWAATAVSDHEATTVLGTKAGRPGTYYFVKLDAPGVNSITASYNKTQRDVQTGNAKSFEQKNPKPFPDPVYPASIDVVDRTSKGDGLFKYGSDGFVLLGCNGTVGDISRLPKYVANVNVTQHGFPGWVVPKREFLGYSDSDSSFLPLYGRGDRSIRKRGLGRVGFNDEGGGDINCLLVDVKLADDSKPVSFALSIYSVGNSNNNRHAIRAMDLDTFNVIAPTTLIDNYTEGVWYTIRYNKSIRLKFMDIKGIYISAVAFATNENEHYESVTT